MAIADSDARISENLQFRAGELLTFERTIGQHTIFAKHNGSGRTGIVPTALVKLHLSNEQQSASLVHPHTFFEQQSASIVQPHALSEQQPRCNSDSRHQNPHAYQSSTAVTVPSGSQTQLHDLSSFEWFHGSITRNQAQARLLNAADFVDGLYLVRLRENGLDFALSVLCASKRTVDHYIINTQGPQFVLAEQKEYPFASMPELIRYCSQQVRHLSNTAHSSRLGH